MKVAGATVDKRDNMDRTALHLACQFRQAELASFLVGAGAAVNAETSTGATPLGISIMAGNLACVKVLVEEGGAGPSDFGSGLPRVGLSRLLFTANPDIHEQEPEVRQVQARALL